MSKSDLADADARESGKSAERRDFFRVNENVLFDFRIVDMETAERGSAESALQDSACDSLIGELRKLDRESAATLQLLSEKNPDLADHLQCLGKKIDLLARHSLINREESCGNKPAERINLSEDGIAFHSNRVIYKNGFVVVRMIFLPGYLPITAFARVVRCQEKDGVFQVAAKFHRLPDTSRQILSREILRIQVEQKKKNLAQSSKK